MPRNLVTASLRSSSGAISIEADAGIIKSVKLMELGKVARFSGEDGKPKQVTITDAHIAALLAHAGNRAIPIHETHEWFNAQGKANADSVEREARIGALKGFRKDAAGNLIADAYLNLQKQPARDLIWGAEHNPEDNCFSVVFSYLADDPECIPQNFRAGDIVPSGAATTALFSEETKSASMDITELLAALDDPAVKAAVKAILKSHTGPEEEAEAAAMESDSGVTDDDKKKDDDQKPALMRATLRCNRARDRKLNEALAKAPEKVAFLAEVKTAAAAEVTALLGKGAFIGIGEGNKYADVYTATLAEYRKTSKNDEGAIFRMLSDHPELYDAHKNATVNQMAKLRANAA